MKRREGVWLVEYHYAGFVNVTSGVTCVSAAECRGVCRGLNPPGRRTYRPAFYVRATPTRKVKRHG